MHCNQCNNEGTCYLKENGVLVTCKKEVAAIFNNYFFLIQNACEEHEIYQHTTKEYTRRIIDTIKNKKLSF